MLKEGDQAPIFRIETDEEIFELKLKNDNKIIIFFFPRADTSGCTKEAIDFSLLSEKFNDLNVQVIGISKDKVIQQEIRDTTNKLILLQDQHGKFHEPGYKKIVKLNKQYVLKDI